MLISITFDLFVGSGWNFLEDSKGLVPYMVKFL